jgi:ketosteroid isomerase-like protein
MVGGTAVSEGEHLPRRQERGGRSARASDPKVTSLGPTEVVTAVNQAWRDGRFEELGSLFHPDAVIVGPDLTPVARGRDACVQSYAEFSAAATVHEFDETWVRLHEYGNAAVVGYEYRIRYEFKDGAYDERGREVILLVRRDETWQVAWRLVLPPPS